MATTKSKKTTAKKKSSAKPRTSASKSTKTEKTEKAEVRVVENTNLTEEKPLAGFFDKKCDPSENILTIFKTPKIYGAILGELIGTMLIAMLLLTLGIYQPLYLMFGVMAVTVAVYAFSGAHLNPLITVGMMASRRVSAIRGVLYIIAQVVGAWLGLMLVNAFIGDSETVTLPAMAAIEEGNFWVVTMIEFIGATMIGFFFARALSYKRSVFTFAAVVGGGVAFAVLIAIVISSNFLGLQNNFILNPAIAIMYQILPTTGDNFGQLLGDIALALVTYVIFPMLGGALGFGIADVASRLSGERICHCGHCDGHHHHHDK